MTRPPRPQPTGLLLALGGIVLLGLVGYWMFRSLTASVFSNNTAFPTSAEYAAWVGLRIPATAQNWQSYAEGFQDWFVQARFELSPEALPRFLSENNLVRAPELNGPPQNLLKQDWFNPRPPLEVYQLRSSQTQQARTASGFYPTVYIERGPSSIVVYITAFNT